MSDAVVDVVQDQGNSAEVNEADLQKMLDNARANLAAVESRAVAAESRAVAAEVQRDTAVQSTTSAVELQYAAQKQSIESQLSATKSNLERAETEYERAMEAGDHKAATKANSAIALAAAQQDRLSVQRDWLETNKERIVPKVQAPERRVDMSDPYAALGLQLVGAEKDWLTQRPNFLNDTKYRNRVFGASQMAENEGHARGTDPYFQRMEDLLGERQRTEPTEPSEPITRRPSADLAPARRPAPGANPSSSRQIKLTADQVEAARGLFGNPGNADSYEPDETRQLQKYANYLEKLKASGRLN